MKAHEAPKEPIACTLGAGAYRERLAWITGLNRSALQSVRREGPRMILAYDRGAAVRVREMIRREQECCAFLDFELDEGASELMLVITAPEMARDALVAVFDPFVKGSNSSAGGCACAARAQ